MCLLAGPHGLSRRRSRNISPGATYFLSSSYRDRPATETIAAMTLAITMNPYFLMHK